MIRIGITIGDSTIPQKTPAGETTKHTYLGLNIRKYFLSFKIIALFIYVVSI